MRPNELENRTNIKYAIIILLVIIVTNSLNQFITCDLKDKFLPCEASALFLQVQVTREDHIAKDTFSEKFVLLVINSKSITSSGEI